MKNYFILLLIVFCNSIVLAQTYRDTLSAKIINNYNKDKFVYNELKSNIEKLEKLEGKPNPEILYNNLEFIYEQNDIKYFQEVITLLTAKYGFNISYLDGNENYYDAIIDGKLSKWFKKMYINKHSTWLSKNLGKQIDIYKLNTLAQKDQIASNILQNVKNSLDLNEDQIQKIRDLDAELFSTNITELEHISSKIGSLPTGNSFALIQQPYNIVEWHGFQHEKLFYQTFKTLYPYYKDAYLKMNISSIRFRNIDSFLFMNKGNQIFDLLNPENIPIEMLKDSKYIPLEDAKQTLKIKKELNWN